MAGFGLNLVLGFFISGLIFLVSRWAGLPAILTEAEGLNWLAISGYIGISFLMALLVIGVVFPMGIRGYMKLRAKPAPDELQAHVSGLSKVSGALLSPKVFVANSKVLNAFATPGTVVITTALLKLLSADEIKATLAHEVSHIRSWDTIRFVLVSLTMSTLIYYVPLTVAYEMFISGMDGWKVAFHSSKAALFLLTFLVLFAYMRKREFAADAFAGEFGYRQPAISALERLHVAHPVGRLKQLFSTHPSVKARVRSLASAGEPK